MTFLFFFFFHFFFFYKILRNNDFFVFKRRSVSLTNTTRNAVRAIMTIVGHLFCRSTDVCGDVRTRLRKRPIITDVARISWLVRTTRRVGERAIEYEAVNRGVDHPLLLTSTIVCVKLLWKSTNVRTKQMTSNRGPHTRPRVELSWTIHAYDRGDSARTTYGSDARFRARLGSSTVSLVWRWPRAHVRVYFGRNIGP